MKISVVVPIYNVAPYLPQCINSIISQTLQDIEIILVDDGSTDGGGDICDEYAQKDDRIKVIHKENEGLSAARNDGIALSTAPYIMFVDADDWVDPEFCEKPYETAIKTDADLVLFHSKSIQNDGRIICLKTDLPAGRLNERQALYFNVRYGENAWLGLYKRELFDDIRYPVGKYFEDSATSHRLIHAAKKTFLIDELLYNYRAFRPGSITAEPATKNHPDIQEMFFLKVKDLINWGYEEFAQYESFRLVEKYGQKRDDQKPFVEIVQKIDRIPDCFTLKQKLMLHIFRFSPPLFDLICKVTGKRLD